MSIDFRSIREIPNDPFGKLLADLSRRLSAADAKTQAELVDNPEDIYADGQDVESKINYHSYAMAKKFDLATDYYSAAEPDNDKVKSYLGTWPNLGNQMADDSGFNNHATILGEPTIIDGTPFDNGLVDGTNNVKSLAVRFNRPTSEFVNTEYMTIPDSTAMQISGLSTGFSLFIRFRLLDLAQQGGINRTITAKIDDSTPNNGRLIKVDTDGTLRLVILKGGTETKKKTAASVISANTVYGLVLTFANSGSAVHAYTWIDEGSATPTVTDQTLSADSTAAGWHSTLSNHDLSFFRRGAGTTGGYSYADFFPPYIFWQEKILSSTEVNNLAKNKFTTADINRGQVAISNYSASNSVPAFTGSFSSTSFSPTSFTIGS